MKTHHRYTLLAVLPLLALLFFGLTVRSMVTTENALMNLYSEHTTFLEKVALNPTQRENLTREFASKIKLSARDQASLERSIQMQKMLDAATFSTPHCLNAPKSTDCRVYSPALIAAARNRHAKILLLTGQEPPSESILSATPLGAKDYARYVILLLLEGLALSSIALWLWSKKQ